MSLHGQTKGTSLEKMAETLALGEAHGVMMYYALARLAKEQGYDDIAANFIEAANQEAVHSGFYATLNAKYPKEFWGMVRGLMTEGEGKADSKCAWRYGRTAHPDVSGNRHILPHVRR